MQNDSSLTLCDLTFQVCESDSLTRESSYALNFLGFFL